MKILMVCLGNICRSPLAEGIMKAKLKSKGLDGYVDSAGVISYHSGEPPDNRATQVARNNGIDITDQRARQIKKSDFSEFDLILTMDRSVHQDVLSIAGSAGESGRIHMFTEFAGLGKNKDVPDPYWGGSDGFEKVFNLIDSACESIISRIEKQ